MKILLYTSRPSSRLAYIAHYVLEQLLGNELAITSNKDEFRAFAGVRINYSPEELNVPALRLCPHSLLFESDIREQVYATTFYQECPVLFTTNSSYDLPFDPFASSFYLLSRYEEYLPFTADQHGRYSAELSWAYRENCLDQPIIWRWAKLLAAALQQHFPNWQPSSPTYQFTPTYDVDIPWAYLHRSWRGMLRTGLDVAQGRWPQLRERIAVQTGRAEDPFFTFPQLAALHQETAIRPRVFWLLGDTSRHDINPSHRLFAYQELIRATSEWSDPGIHPSYASFSRRAQIEEERQRLSQIVEQEITHSRQHFLRFRLPQTYRDLLAAGLRHDYSMGYAAAAGYRAGTSEPFQWYDLEKEEKTELWIHPFVAMDVTLKQYLGLSPNVAQAKLLDMQAYCQREQLTFATLWHNSSFSATHDWSGWWEVYRSLYFN